MNKWQIPSGWEWKTLSEISEINPRRPRIQRDNSQPTSFVPMEDVDEIEGRFRQVQIKPYQDVKSGYTYFEENDVLYAKITPSMENGKTAIARKLIDGFGFGTTEFHVLRPNPGILPEYLHYFIRRVPFRLEARQHFRGAVGQQRVPKDFLITYPFPVPFPAEPERSLAEQRRIVAWIEALLAEVREMRQLHGEITAAADQLMQACIQEVFGQQNDRWQTDRLSEVALIQTGVAKGGRYRDKQLVDIPYLRVANVQAGFLDLEEIKTLSIPEEKIERHRLEVGDLLLTEGGDYDKLGRGAIWEGQIELCVHQNHVFAVRFDQQRVLPKFAEYEMQSRYAKDYFLRVAKKTTNLASINKTQLSNFPIRYPTDLAEQEQITNYLDVVFSEVVEMQKSQTEDGKLVDELEQAILTQAFRGEL